MIEFAPGYRQVKVNHLTRNYFPLVTPEPTPGMYEDRARHNPAVDPDTLRERRVRNQLFDFFALSELALLVATSFGKPEEVRKARGAIANRNMVRRIGSAIRLPYTLSSIQL